MLYNTGFKYNLHYYYAKEAIVFVCVLMVIFLLTSKFERMKKNVKNAAAIMLWFVWVILAFGTQAYQQEGVLIEWAYYLICVSGLIVTSFFYYKHQRQTTVISLRRVISVAMFVSLSLDALWAALDANFGFDRLVNILIIIVYMLVLTGIANAHPK